MRDKAPPLSRRSFLKHCGLASVATGLITTIGVPALASVTAPPPPRVHWLGETRDVFLFNPNTRERTQTVFYAHGNYNNGAIKELCHFLRDHHENATHMMDPKLLTLLNDMQCIFDKREIHIISGYRTARTNAQLRRSFPGVAKDSFHMKGQAVDIRIPGVETRAIRDVAKILGMGGVGYYPSAHFVHVDTGPIRTW